MPTMQDVLGVVMGGGQGTRLYPLTKLRAKPAVPIGGKYRLIDVPISNCINAGIHKIAILTQFKSVSLHRHISRTYNFDIFSNGWVQIFAAEQRDKGFDWYQGTADAVRKQLLEIEAAGSKYTLILAGDHLYRMDLDELAAFHWDRKADITIAVQPVRRADGSRFGLLKAGREGRILDFTEKPTDKKILKRFETRKDEARPYLGSMGIYLFNTDLLIDLLNENDFTDFGSDVIPYAIKHHLVFGYSFDGYWEDIGTIRSFYETNLKLAKPNPPFNFHDLEDPIFTRPRFLPGSFMNNAHLNNVLMAEGCYVNEAVVTDSVVGLRSQISKGAKVDRTVILGADYYDTPEQIKANQRVPIGIGPGCDISGAILDKNARIGKDVVIKPFPRGTDIETDNWVVRDGIVVIPKDTILLPDTIIKPE